MVDPESEMISMANAGREFGSYQLVEHAVRTGALESTAKGHRKFITRKDFEAWKARLPAPAKDHIKLGSLSKALGVTQNNLCVFAKDGLIEGAVQLKRFAGKGADATKFGTWYIPQAVADRLIANRGNGVDQPWQVDQKRKYASATYERWVVSKHPEGCHLCAQIFGGHGAPTSRDQFVELYLNLPHGAKRHLVTPWTPGYTKPELARKAGLPIHVVERAVRRGALAVQGRGRAARITEESAKAWLESRALIGSWQAVRVASQATYFTEEEIRAFIAEGRLACEQVGGRLTVPIDEVRKLREAMPLSEEQAAAIVGIPAEQARKMLATISWYTPGSVSLHALRELKERSPRRQAITITAAAQKLGTSVAWVERCIADGVAVAKESPWVPGERVLTSWGLKRLVDALRAPPNRTKLDAGWIRSEEAALLAGVVRFTLEKWAERGLVNRLREGRNWRYETGSVREQAIKYWTVRSNGAKKPPPWVMEQLMASQP